MKSLSAALLTIAVGGVTIFLSACGGGGSNTATPTPPPTVSPTASAPSPVASPTPAASATARPFAGGVTPVAGTLGAGGGATAQAALVDVRAANQGASDRITFQFDAAGPAYRVEYVASPVQCASGQPVALTAGQAALQVKFTPAVAHNAAGAPTFATTTLSPALSSIVKAVQSCDFEADVTWVVIVSGQLDFRVTALTDPVRLAVDVAHP